MHIIKFGRRKIFTKLKQYIQTILAFTPEVCYAICKGPTKDEQGLFYYNLDEIVKNI
jgi:hypothetical protein